MNSNPYETPTTISSGDSAGELQPGLVIRGLRVGGTIGAVSSFALCCSLFVMHGRQITAISIIVLLVGPIVSAGVGAVLAGISIAEKRLRERK